MDQAAEIIEVPQSPAIIETSNDPPIKPKARARIYFSFTDSIQLSEIPFVLMLFLGVFIFGITVFPLGIATFSCFIFYSKQIYVLLVFCNECFI
jgi:hypothetical protein